MIDWLKYIFDYSTDPENAFFFNRYVFWVFFAAMLLVYSLLYKKTRIRNVYLTLFSLFFYWKSGGFYFLLLLFSTITDFHFGKWIYNSDKESRRKLWVICSVALNLGVLAYFKYGEFFVGTINDTMGTHFHAVDVFKQAWNGLTGANFDIANIFLPIGISFYTFQTISYTVDVYRKQVRPVRDIVDFAFYVSFFPQLVAGPIVRASDFVPQIYKPYQLTQDMLGKALFLIMSGMIKKILIADFLGANFVGMVFAEPEKFTGFQNLLAVYGFALQIYGDFSGYTDIAIGIALLLGFRLPLNFNSPYKAVNITDFWRRWHISLSTWLRDYLYIPLGGNRQGSFASVFFILLFIALAVLVTGSIWLLVALVSFVMLAVIIMWRSKPLRSQFYTYMNLTVTMLLGGLWHGAAIRFIVWGALHGGALALHKLWMSLIKPGRKASWLSHLFWGFITFHFVCLCWIYFAAKDMNSANFMVKQITTHFYPQLVWDTIVGYNRVVIVMAIGFILHFLPSRWKDFGRWTFIVTPWPVKAATMLTLAILLFQVMAADVQPFIYFQF